MEFDFTATMASNDDKELIRIVTVDREHFQPAAVLAAEQELSKRKIDMADYEHLFDSLNFEKQIRERRANEPLDIGFKILAVVFPGVLMLIISGYFRANGYDWKSNQ